MAILNNVSSSFRNRNDARDYISNKFTDYGMSLELSLRVAENFVDEFKVIETAPGLRVQISQWVVKNDDLDLLSVFSPAAITIVTAATDLKSSPAVVAAIVTSISSIAILARRISSYSIWLTRDQYEVLIALKRCGADGSLHNIEDMMQVDCKEKNLERIEKTLIELSELRGRSGEIRALVEQDSSQRWHVLDV